MSELKAIRKGKKTVIPCPGGGSSNRIATENGITVNGVFVSETELKNLGYLRRERAARIARISKIGKKKNG